MEELWLFGQAISIFLLGCGAIICLANVGISDAATARGDPAASFVEGLQKHGDHEVNILGGGQLPDPQNELVRRFGDAYRFPG